MESNLNEDKIVNGSNGNLHVQKTSQSSNENITNADTVLEDLLSDTNQDENTITVLEDILKHFKQESGLFKWWGGPYQFVVFLGAISAMAIDGINLFIFVFVNTPVDYHCSSINSNDSDIFNASLSKCTVGIESDTNSTVSGSCSNWTYDTSEYSSTITTEFNLVCSQSWLSPAYQTCYILGTLAGDLLGGTISDRFGRRTAFRIGVLASFLCVLVIGFSPWLPLILFARVMQGIAYTVMFCPSITLMTEITLPEHRSFAGIVLDIFYAIAIMILSGLAYLIRDWRILHFSTSFIAVALIPLALFVDESVRWLIQQGRLEEAQKVLERVARWNDKSAEYKRQESHIREKLQEIQKTSNIDTNASDESFGTWLKSGFQQLYGHPVMRLISFVAPLFMFLMSVLYNGLPFNANNFGGSTYWYMFGMGAMEMGSVMSGILVVKYCSRIFMAQWTVGLSASCVLLTTFMPESVSFLNWFLVMIAMWSIAMTYNMEFMWVDEMFPTSVRQRGGAICHFVAHLSGFAALLITGVMSSLGWWLPNVVLSSCGAVAIFLATLLPETKGLDMCNTVDDVVRRRDDSRNRNRNVVT